MTVRTSADLFSITVDGTVVIVPQGITVAAALMNAGLTVRQSVQGEPRAALCGMGICQECRVTIDGRQHQRSCLRTVAPGMVIRRDE
jgi:predicted molibdopterin-dependent oxidoreductase YjgC